MPNLEDFRVESSVPSAYYIPNFISPEEEDYLLEKIISEAQLDEPVKGYIKLESRTLQRFGGEVATTQKSDGTTKSVLIPSTIPSHLVSYPPILARLKEYGLFVHSPHKAPNHVLVNIYQPGQGIAPHEDGPAYHAMVCTISLGGQAILDYLAYKEGDGHDKGGRSIDIKPVLSVLQEPRSLLVTTDELYRLLHTMPATVYDNTTIRKLGNLHLLSTENRYLVQDGGPEAFPRTLRVSLTYRDVKLVSKALSLGKK